MNLIRLNAALIAAVTASTPISADSTVLLTSSTAFAQDTIVFADLPDWIPSDFESAVEFRNTYGATHIDDGLICIVYPNRAGKDTCGHELRAVKGTGYKLKQEIYTHEFSKTCFDVIVYQPSAQGDVTLELMDPYSVPVTTAPKGYPDHWEQPVAASYSFEVDQSLSITETDIFSWLPDSTTEYYEYTKKNGEVSVKDNYVVFCMSTIDQFGDKWEAESNNGYENIKYLLTSDCTMQVPDLYDDGSIDKISVYQAVKDGSEKISWIRTSGARPDPDEPATYTLTADCAVLDDAQTILLPGQIRATLADFDTGENIILTDDTTVSIWTDISDGVKSTGPILAMETNPAILSDDLGSFFDSAVFSFGLEEDELPEGYSFIGDEERPGYYSGTILPENSMTVTRFDNGSADVVFKLKYTPTGDINNDGGFSVADAVLLQKWLLAVPDIELPNWRAADFCCDNKLDTFDLCLVKRELIRRTAARCVKPDYEISDGADLHVVADEITMHFGPNTRFGIVTTIPRDTMLTERGVQTGNDNWAFVEYEGEYGWIQMVNDDGETQVIAEELPYVAKPVIYLYPESEADVHVELELTEAELSTTYPKYNNGWDVAAYPDGTILNKADGTHHRYLFWDAVNCRTRFDFSKGFCVAGSDTESFLKEKLTYMGLTEDEMNEFIVYWLPLMEHNRYNLISFQGEVYTNSAKLDITPAPDSLLRVFMAYVPLENAVDIEPQKLSAFERKGFTVVEWGGSRISR
jgi:hypothetical protein